MFKLPDISTRIVADLNPLKAKFTEAQSQARNFASRMQSEMSGAGSSIASAFGGVTTAITKWGAALAGVAAGGLAGAAIWAVKLAADAEQAQVSFTTMLGSVEKAKALLAQIQSFAAATPFETTELVDASKKLLAFGTSADQIIPTMTKLGDVAAGIGIPLGELAELYGKARIQGVLMAEDVNQLTGRGIPVIQEFAKQFGVAESEVKKLVESGQVNFSNLQRAFQSLTDDGGKFSGMMQAQSQTVSGLFSTLHDSVTQNLQRIGESITQNFNLRGAISGVTDALTTAANFVIPMIDKMLASLGNSSTIGERFGAVMSSALEVTAKGIGYAMDGLEVFKAAWYGLRAAAEKSLQGIVYASQTLLEALDYVMQKLGSTNNSFGEAADLAKQFGQGLGQLAAEDADKVVAAISSAWNTEHAKGAGRFFDDMKKQAADVAATAANAAPGAAGPGGVPFKIDAGSFPKMDKELEAFKKGLDGPIEKFDKLMAQLRKWKEEGKISAEEYAKGVSRAMDELEKNGPKSQADKVSHSLPSFIRSGSADVERLKFSLQGGGKKMMCPRCNSRKRRSRRSC